MRLSEAPLNMPSASPMARTLTFSAGSLAGAAPNRGLVLVGIAASLSLRPRRPRRIGPTRDRCRDVRRPVAAAPYWRQQQTSDCGGMAVADVVGQITGDEPAEQRITALAESTPSGVRRGPIWDLTADTDIKDLPELLTQYRIKADNIQTTSRSSA